MSREPRRTICARQSGHGFRQKLNGKRRREDQMGISSPGGTRSPISHSQCLDNTMSMRSPCWQQWIRMRPAKAPMAFIIWRETSPNGCRTGSGPTTTPPCRSAIHRARQPGATKASAAAHGKVIRSCFEQRLETAHLRINAPPLSAFVAQSPRPPRLHSRSQQSSLSLVRREPRASISLLWLCQPASTISALLFALATL
jgi:hypothetical protein